MYAFSPLKCGTRAYLFFILYNPWLAHIHDALDWLCVSYLNVNYKGILHRVCVSEDVHCCEWVLLKFEMYGKVFVPSSTWVFGIEASEWMLLIRHSVECKVNMTVLNFVVVGMALSYWCLVNIIFCALPFVTWWKLQFAVPTKLIGKETWLGNLQFYVIRLSTLSSYMILDALPVLFRVAFVS